MTFFLTLKSLKERKFSSFLCILSVALSVCLILSVGRIRDAAEDSFTNTVSGVDLVVGARSGDLNLILYTLFHMGSPTNNLRFSTFETVKKMPEVKWTIPISLGDNFRGHRVIGTNSDFFKHYKYADKQPLEFLTGDQFKKFHHVVLGYETARKQRTKVGDLITLTHGGGQESLLDHDNIKFEVTGVLKQTFTPIDKAVFVSLEGMKAMHVGWETGIPEDVPTLEELQTQDLSPRSLTTFLLQTKSKFQLLRLRSKLANFQGEPLSAVIPGLALSELWTLLGQVEAGLLFISICVFIVALLSITIALMTNLKDRKRELSILRSIGAGPLLISSLLIVESLFLNILGIITGVVSLFLGLKVISPLIESLYGVHIPLSFLSLEELQVLGIFLACGFLSGIIPAIQAYRTSLHQGLSL
ncbi:MAG: ABC transporter permease [Bacteriovoracaceae bacterium]